MSEKGMVTKEKRNFRDRGSMTHKGLWRMAKNSLMDEREAQLEEEGDQVRES